MSHASRKRKTRAFRQWVERYQERQRLAGVRFHPLAFALAWPAIRVDLLYGAGMLSGKRARFTDVGA